MTGLVIMIAGALAWAAFLLWLEGSRRTRCGCGRSVRWYFERRHETTWVQVVLTIWYTLLAVLVVLPVGPLSFVIALLTAWHWRRLYLHEKGKRRGALRRLLGRVVVNHHGRLEVQAR